MAAFGLPFVFMAVATSISAMPPMVPPPCASLNASPRFHASKSSKRSHTVHEMSVRQDGVVTQLAQACKAGRAVAVTFATYS